jgi:hypothetical protein
MTSQRTLWERKLDVVEAYLREQPPDPRPPEDAR